MTETRTSTRTRTLRVTFFVDEAEGKTYHSAVLWTTHGTQGPYAVTLEELQAVEHRNTSIPLQLGVVLGFNDTDGKAMEELERDVGRAVMSLAAEVNGINYEKFSQDGERKPVAYATKVCAPPDRPKDPAHTETLRCDAHGDPLPCGTCAAQQKRRLMPKVDMEYGTFSADDGTQAEVWTEDDVLVRYTGDGEVRLTGVKKLTQFIEFILNAKAKGVPL